MNKGEYCQAIGFVKCGCYRGRIPRIIAWRFRIGQQDCREIRRVSVAGLARAVEKDIDSAAGERLKGRKNPEFMSFWPPRRFIGNTSSSKAKEEILNLAVRG